MTELPRPCCPCASCRQKEGHRPREEGKQVTDDELARLEALVRAASTSELGAAARAAVPALVAEVRRLRDLAIADDLRRDTMLNERDALRAENERLRSELQYEAITDRAALGAERDAARLTSEELVRANLAMARERDALRIEAAELRASLADAVGKIAAMEPVVEAALQWHHEPAGTDFAELSCNLQMAVLEYEASLPGLANEILP